MSEHKLYLYPVWLRIWHGINALCIILLIFTGISMQYGSLQYPLVPFRSAVMLHNIAGTILAINYLGFLIGNLISGNGRNYFLRIRGCGERLSKQAMYYMFGYFKGEPKPFPINETRKFNPLQRLSYSAAMYLLVPAIIITGIGLLYPEVIFTRIFNMGGVQLTAILHSIIGFFISIFLFIHLYVVTIGKHPLRNFKSIATGYHESD